jgi:SagB-type dehydrogenase family enzyme
MSDILKRRPALAGVPGDRRVSVSELYHENTKLHPTMGQAMALDTYSNAEMATMSRAYKRYPLFPRVALPAVGTAERAHVLFDRVLASRRSVRSFSADSIPLDDISHLLHQTYGITGQMALPGGGVQHFRAAPSAGALYPAEIYVGARNVAGLEPGIYHFDVVDHALALLRQGDPTETLWEVCCRQEYARQAAVTILISGVFERTKRKYGERGYRYVFLDVGHLTENLCLSATSLGLAVTTTCGFFDDAANRALHLDGLEEAVLYVAFVGTRLDEGEGSAEGVRDL